MTSCLTRRDSDVDYDTLVVIFKSYDDEKTVFALDVNPSGIELDGQMEADPSEVNFSAYETFFEEKISFLIERSQIFNYRIGISDGDMWQKALFYFRRFGIRPHHEPDIPEVGFLDQPHYPNISGAVIIIDKTNYS